MEKITVRMCCALCNNLWNTEKCPLYEVYEAASRYGDSTFDDKAKYSVRCDDFLLNANYQK